MTRLVGLDVGTTSVKGIAIDQGGAVVHVAERGYPLSTPRPGWSEQDPELWWKAAAEVLDECDADRALGIGLSGQMHGLVALDANDRPLRPAILWNDGRTQKQCDEIEERVGRERLIELTGNRALAGFTAPKLLWLREEEPETYAQIALHPAAEGLRPAAAVRASTRSTSPTPRGRCCSTSRGGSGAPRSSLRSRSTRSGCRACRSRPRSRGRPTAGVPVAAGAGDQAAGALGVGVVAEGGPASVVLGTSGVVFAALDRYAADPEGRVHAFCHAVPGAWHVMGVMLSAAGSLRWLRDTIGGDVSYDDLIAGAERWEPGVEGLLFAPYLAGERTPYPDPDARGAFLGLGLRHDRGAIARAVLEGVAFGLRDALDLVVEMGGRPASGRVSGGGGRGMLWLEIVASVLGIPLELTRADEGAAYGAALLGGVAAGVWGDAREAVDTCVRVTRTIEPRPGWVERYAELQPAFRRVYPALVAARGG